MTDLKTLLNENNQNIKNYIDAIQIIYDSENKKIILSNGKNVESSIEATDFIKDGMIEKVELIDKNLIITWNTDAGKNATTIPFNDFIDIYTIEGENTDTIDITASTEGNTHTVKAEIINNSITNEHIAENASITADKLSEEVQEALNLAKNSVQVSGHIEISDGQLEMGKEQLIISTDRDYIYGYTDNEISFQAGPTNQGLPHSFIKLLPENISFEAYNEKEELQTSLRINQTAIYANNDIILSNTNPSQPYSVVSKKYVDDAITNADISASLTDYVKQEQLNDYVTDSELSSTLIGYAKKDEITGDIIVNNDWNDIENRPEYFDTNWELIKNKPEILQDSNIGNIITKNSEDIKEINTKIQQNQNSISSLDSGVNAAYNNANSAIEIANSAIEIANSAIKLDENNSVLIDGTISAGNISSNSIEINLRGGKSYIKGSDDGIDLIISNEQGNIELRPNGNMILPSNYSILDEDGNDRLVNKPLCYTGNIIKFLNDDSTGMTSPIIKEDTEFGSKIYYTQFGNVLSLNVNTAFYSSDFEETSYYKAHLIKLPSNFISKTNKDYKYLVKIYYRKGSVENLKTITNALLSQVTEKREYLEIDLSFLTSKNISTFETYSDIFIEISYFHQETT